MNSCPNAPRNVYVVHGPNGPCYVGATMRTLEARWKSHCSIGVDSHLCTAFTLFIREHGRSAFHLEHVACARNFSDGLATEYALIAQLTDEGASLLNTVGMPLSVQRQRRAAARKRSSARHVAYVDAHSPETAKRCRCAVHVAMRRAHHTATTRAA